MNRLTDVDESVLDLLQQFPVQFFLDVLPDQKEVNRAIAQMNNGKSPGMDGILAEVLKSGGDGLKKMVFEVITHVWDTSAPQDWRDAILESLFKDNSLSDLIFACDIAVLAIFIQNNREWC